MIDAVNIGIVDKPFMTARQPRGANWQAQRHRLGRLSAY
jgi:hypothetical protein